MAKKLIRKYLPHPDDILNNRWIKLLGPRLQNASLWHVNRRSFSGGVAVGMFFAFMPVPFQMLLAAMGAITFRVNILVAIPMVWVSNPVTMPPLFYFCYLVGARMLGIEPGNFQFELSFDWLFSELSSIWAPFLLGCLIVAITTSALSFVLVRVSWHLHILRHLQQRKLRLHNRHPKVD